MSDRAHLTLQGLELIVSKKAIMNTGLSDQLIAAFPGIPSLTRPAYIPSTIPLNPAWVSGFVEGDGSFYVANFESKYFTPI
jgi:hypothetical protein